MPTGVKKYQRSRPPCARLSEKAKKEMKSMTLDSARIDRELGAVICEQKGKLELGPICSGEQCQIPAYKFLASCEDGKKAGTFHTHGKSGPFPSDADIDITFKMREPVIFIGGMRGPQPWIRGYYNVRKVEALEGTFFDYDEDACEVD